MHPGKADKDMVSGIHLIHRERWAGVVRNEPFLLRSMNGVKQESVVLGPNRDHGHDLHRQHVSHTCAPGSFKAIAIRCKGVRSAEDCVCTCVLPRLTSAEPCTTGR